MFRHESGCVRKFLRTKTSRIVGPFASPHAILSFMAKYSDQLDAMFTALADPTRRTVIHRLGHGSASVGELAEPLSISLPSFMKHVRALESCGLIRTSKSGRVRTCVLNRDRLKLLNDWLAEQRLIWEASTDRLEQFVTDGAAAGADADGRR